MQDNENLKISLVKNMNKLNLNSTLSIPIDSNANVKTVLSVDSYLLDCKAECGSGKAIINGKVGVKVVYVDTDNFTNSISSTQNFSETYLDNSITSDCYLNISKHSIENNILSSSGVLKINCNITISPVAYLNLGFNNSLNLDNSIITKTKEIQSYTIANIINTQFENSNIIEVANNVSKILSIQSCAVLEKATPSNNLITLEGKIICNLLYEIQENDDACQKFACESFRFKTDIEQNNISESDLLDLSICVDKATDTFTTETETDSTLVTVKNNLLVNGVSLRKIDIEICDDLFCTTCDVEANKTKREATILAENFNISEVVFNETTIQASEPAIDNIIANLNINPEITNTYIKNGTVFVEGVVSSNIIYIDENKSIQSKTIESPFVVNTKIEKENLDGFNSTISIIDNKTKVKRGTIIETEYSLFINMTIHTKSTIEIIDNFKLGKPIINNFDYQIFIAKPNETIWDLAKRIKIAPDELIETNKSLPEIMNGGERVIIKRN